MKTVLVTGDEQARAVALVLRALPDLYEGHEILYGSTVTRDQAAACTFSYEQYGATLPRSVKLPKTCRRIVFPPLRFKLLWPMNAPNPYNRPEPPAFPLGRFPFGDQFVISCIEQGLAVDDIMRHYQAPAWNESWPNLDRLFREESAALSALDSKCEVKMGSFVLKHFRKERLFWAFLAPSNKLLTELVYRILHASFGPGLQVERPAISAALAAFSGRDMFAGIAVPVHPLVAEHFRLEWYDPRETYASFGGTPRTFSEYFREMIAHARS